jgi:hypothetical protein
MWCEMKIITSMNKYKDIVEVKIKIMRFSLKFLMLVKKIIVFYG